MLIKAPDSKHLTHFPRLKIDKLRRDLSTQIFFIALRSSARYPTNARFKAASPACTDYLPCSLLLINAFRLWPRALPDSTGKARAVHGLFGRSNRRAALDFDCFPWIPAVLHAGAPMERRKEVLNAL